MSATPPINVEIPVTDLLLDENNARLKIPQENQSATIIALAGRQRDQLLKLAEGIAEKGFQDSFDPPIVIRAEGHEDRYIVLEGNRRVLCLKALETPSLVTPAFTSRQNSRLKKLSDKFRRNPVEDIRCILVAAAEDAEDYITLKHTGQNEGAGLVGWGPDEQDRYKSRHRQSKRSAEGQILDLVEESGLLSKKAKGSDKSIFTSVRRLLSTPQVRQRLGIEIKDSQVFTRYPYEEVIKGLVHVVEDLKTNIKVADIYHAEDRINYINSLSAANLPDPSKSLESPLPLEGSMGRKAGEAEEEREGDDSGTKPTKPRTKGKSHERKTLIPKDCILNIDNPPRIKRIYRELKTLKVEEYCNSCSVILRVFLELSVDAYLSKYSLMLDKDKRNQPLAKRMKVAADNLESKGDIDQRLKDAIYRVADSNTNAIAASTVTFNKYVHNQYVLPKPTELQTVWDELQPFMQKLWP